MPVMRRICCSIGFACAALDRSSAMPGPNMRSNHPFNMAGGPERPGRKLNYHRIRRHQAIGIVLIVAPVPLGVVIVATTLGREHRIEAFSIEIEQVDLM